MSSKILVTGAAGGNQGATGNRVTRLLREKGLPVRREAACFHRRCQDWLTQGKIQGLSNDCQQKRQQRCSDGAGSCRCSVGLCSRENVAIFGRKRALKRPIPTLASNVKMGRLRGNSPEVSTELSTVW